MEQRHLAAKSHWYHETQSRPCPAETPVRVADLPRVADAFLLDYPWPDTLCAADAPWLETARALARLYFPPRVALDRLHTLSPYDRLSTALTVAQVYGVQRLCSHYSARLAPEPGPDSSRESNHRLTQITQFARQLAGNPSCIDNAATRQLLSVGLTENDVVTFVHLIGFVGFQARVIAALHAFNGMTARWLPGMDIPGDAPADRFISLAEPAGEPALAPEPYTLPVTCGADTAPLHPLSGVLARDPESWRLLNRLTVATPDAHTACLIRLLSARVNGSLPCFMAASRDWSLDQALPEAIRNGERAIHAWGHGHPRFREIIEPVLLMIRAPSRIGAGHIAGLSARGLNSAGSFQLLTRAALAGWINRLNISLYGRPS